MDHHYLVAEDDENTQVLVERAFKHLDVAAPLHFVSDGKEAIAYLDGNEPYQDRRVHPLPALLLLDFKMPRQDGLDVLRWVRASYLREMVVVMFSASDVEKDVLEAYRLGVNSFVHKPVSFQELQQVLSSIHHYWFGCNYFPNAASGIWRRHKSEFKTVRLDGSA